jgi:Tfp pilus assembly protein PilV
MRAIDSIRKSRQRQSGMSLIELMIALVVLVVGVLALMTLVITAIGSNNRNKLDTTGTMLGQTVLEGILARPATANGTFDVTDCNPGGAQTWHIATTGANPPAGAGAAIDAGTGNIDFTQAYSSVPADYGMLYVTCGAASTQATYDVRWNIQSLTGYTKLVTVSARQIGAGTGGAAFFSPPITLRGIAGQ